MIALTIYKYDWLEDKKTVTVIEIKHSIDKNISFIQKIYHNGLM